MSLACAKRLKLECDRHRYVHISWECNQWSSMSYKIICFLFVAFFQTNSVVYVRQEDWQSIG